jgi:hypothetical protein
MPQNAGGERDNWVTFKMAHTFFPAQPGTVSQPQSSARTSMISSPLPDSSSGPG